MRPPILNASVARLAFLGICWTVLLVSSTRVDAQAAHETNAAGAPPTSDPHDAKAAAAAFHPAAQPNDPSLRDYTRSMVLIPAGARDSSAKPTASPAGLKCEQVSEKDPTSDLAALNPNAGVLWPGALLQYRSLASGTLSPVTAKRRPIVMYVVDAVPDRPDNGRPVLQVNLRRKVSDPTGSNVAAARESLLQERFFTPPQFLLSVKRAYSLEQGMFSLGLSANWLSASVRASLQSSHYDQQSSFVASITQPFYTLAVDAPEAPEDWFKHWLFFGQSVGDLRQYSEPATNPITFVRSVTYGRIALLSLSSQDDSTAVESALNAAAGWATGSVAGDLTTAQKTVIQNSELKLWVYGGGWGNAGGAVIPSKAIDITGPDKLGALASYLRPSAKADIRWGLPLSYRADFLGDQQVAAVERATTFTWCIPLPSDRRLATIEMAFHVNDDDKDDTSTISADVHDASGRLYAVNGNIGSGQHWDDGGDHGVGLNYSIPIYDSDLKKGLTLHVCMNGSNDDMNYNVAIGGKRLSDGSWWGGLWSGQHLHTGECRDYTLPPY